MKRLIVNVIPLFVAAAVFAQSGKPNASDQAQTPASLIVALSATEARVGNLAPGTKVVWCSLAIEPRRQTIQIVHRNLVTVAGSNGVAAITRRIATRSLWVAVDMTTGAFGVAVPPGFHALALPTGKKRFEHLGNGALSKLVADLQSVELLWVRPGVGAWAGRQSDGDENDGDGKANSHITIAHDRLEPLEQTMPAAPHQFAKDDVLVLIDTDDLSYLAFRVGEKD